MPKLTTETPHALARDEAIRRLKERFGEARDTYGSQVTDLHEQWNGGTLSFSFKVVGMSIAGTVAVEDSAVKLDAELPMAAIMFKGMIEGRIREELNTLLENGG